MVLVPLTVVGVFLMSFWDGFSKNWADYDASSTDAGLRPIALPFPPAEAVEWAAAAIPGLSRWSVVESDPEAGMLHATHTTLLWRFVDDVRLRFLPDPERPGGSIVVGQSRSRVGKGDLGQNARNLRALKAALEARAGQLR